MFACCMQVKGENNEVNVKRLPKKPTPPRFGRKLTAAQRERATHICVDCGYIYCDSCVSMLCCPCIMACFNVGGCDHRCTVKYLLCIFDYAGDL
jgi:hypothetical protein